MKSLCDAADEELEGFKRKRKEKKKKKDKKERRLSKKDKKVRFGRTDIRTPRGHPADWAPCRPANQDSAAMPLRTTRLSSDLPHAPCRRPLPQRAKMQRQLRKQLAAASDTEEGAGAREGEGEEGGSAAADIELPLPGAEIPDLENPCTPLVSKAIAALLAAAEQGVEAEAAVTWIRRKVSTPVQLWVRRPTPTHAHPTRPHRLPRPRSHRIPCNSSSALHSASLAASPCRGTRRSSVPISPSFHSSTRTGRFDSSSPHVATLPQQLSQLGRAAPAVSDRARES